MSLQITGKVIKVLPQVENGKYKATPIVIETTNGNYTDNVYLEASGDKADLASKLEPGSNITVHFNVKSREFNSKWYTNLQAWKWDLN